MDAEKVHSVEDWMPDSAPKESYFFLFVIYQGLLEGRGMFPFVREL